MSPDTNDNELTSQNGREANDAAPGDEFYAESFDELSEEDARLIELVGFLVQGIVAHPEEVEVEEFLDDMGSVYGVRVHTEDIGRVIGKDGRVANALRQVVKAAATKVGTHVTVEILTDEVEDNAPDEDANNSGAS